MREVYVLFGDQNTGKTHSLDLLIEMVLGINKKQKVKLGIPNSYIINDDHKVITICKYKCRRVGIVTKGDTKEEVEDNIHFLEECKLFNKYHLLKKKNKFINKDDGIIGIEGNYIIKDDDIVFFAARSENGIISKPTLKVLNDYANNHGALITLIPSTPVSGASPAKYTANQKLADKLYKLI